jgi:hypothetical protein
MKQATLSGIWRSTAFGAALSLLWANPALAGGLRLDYMPGLLYNDDVANIHIAATSELKTEDKFRVEASAVGGGNLWQRTIEPDEKGVFRLVIPPGDRTDMDSCRLLWLRDGKPAETLQFRVLRASEGLPAVSAAGDYLRDGKGDPCMVVAEHRVREHDRTWLPVRVVHDMIKEVPPPPGALVVTDFILEPPKGGPTKFLCTKSDGPPSRPIYEAIAALSPVKEIRPKDSHTLFVGSRDVQAATDPRELRIGLEVLIQHLEKRGAQNIRLVLPIASQQYKERLEIYRREYEEVAYIYRVQRVTRIETRFATDIWRNRWFSPVLWRSPSGEALKEMANVLSTDGLRAK